ncbi:hypothetical protein DESC_720368 [Desulfosarcina cetonica]|nr:hypothetical protein DESC_720368 [Desulfosarcina cetonica]
MLAFLCLRGDVERSGADDVCPGRRLAGARGDLSRGRLRTGRDGHGHHRAAARVWRDRAQKHSAFAPPAGKGMFFCVSGLEKLPDHHGDDCAGDHVAAPANPPQRPLSGLHHHRRRPFHGQLLLLRPSVAAVARRFPASPLISQPYGLTEGGGRLLEIDDAFALPVIPGFVTGNAHEFLGDGAHALDLGFDLGKLGEKRIVWIDGVEEQFGVTGNGHHGLVQLMADGTGGFKHGLEFFAINAFGFATVAVQGDFDGNQQAAGFKGLDHIAEGLHDLGAFQGGRIRIGGKIDHGDAEAVADPTGGFDAVHLALETDIHQDQIRLQGGRMGDGGFPIMGHAAYRISIFFETAFDLLGHDAFVFHHQYGRRCHISFPFWVVRACLQQC